MKRDDTYDFIARCDSYRSLERLFADYAEILKSYGFNSFIFTGLPTHGDDVESYIIKNAWPDEWTDRYRMHAVFVPVTTINQKIGLVAQFHLETFGK